MKILNKRILLVFLPFLSACGTDFLDIKRESNQVVPNKIEDYLALMDFNSVMNTSSFDLVSIGADEHYVSEEIWHSLTGNNLYQRNSYIWAKDIFEGSECTDWNNAYQRILYANMALDVDKIKPLPGQQQTWNTTKGTALFHRAWSYFQLVQTFCPVYDPETAERDLGVPLRLEYDVSLRLGRASLSAVYRQIIADLTTAEDLLSEHVPLKFRPSKLAAQALLAKVFLSMQDYESAGHYADLVLRSNGGLIDFNELDFSLQFTFQQYQYGDGNDEMLFYSYYTPSRILSYSVINVDTNLLALYNDNDLRPMAYFFEGGNGHIGFKGSYAEPGLFFTGMSTNEMYLIRAESQIRSGRLTDGMEDLNQLLRHRYKAGAFEPLRASNQQEALQHIFRERHKELCFRGTRWNDLKRFNLEENWQAKSLTRMVGEDFYQLPAEHPRWTWPIPDNEVNSNGLEQNRR